MKKYVSPELNVELFSIIDMITDSGTTMNHTPDDIPINPDDNP